MPSAKNAESETLWCPQSGPPPSLLPSFPARLCLKSLQPCGERSLGSPEESHQPSQTTTRFSHNLTHSAFNTRQHNTTQRNAPAHPHARKPARPHARTPARPHARTPARPHARTPHRCLKYPLRPPVSRPVPPKAGKAGRRPRRTPQLTPQLTPLRARRRNRHCLEAVRVRVLPVHG